MRVVRHVIGTAAMAALALAVESCSLVYDGARHSDADPLPREQLCTALGDLFCQAARSCCAGVPIPPECGAEYTRECAGSPTLQGLFESPLVVYDAEAAGQWMAEARFRASECDPRLLELLVYEQFFNDIFSGTIGEGEDCSRAGDFVALSCEQPFVCTIVDGNPRCAEPRMNDEPCLTGLDCADGYCDLGGSGLCIGRLPVGVSCRSANECESFACEDNVCAPADLRMLWCPGG